MEIGRKAVAAIRLVSSVMCLSLGNPAYGLDNKHFTGTHWPTDNSKVVRCVKRYHTIH